MKIIIGGSMDIFELPVEPKCVFQVSGLQYVSVTPDQAIVFPSVSFIRNLVGIAMLHMIDSKTLDKIR